MDDLESEDQGELSRRNNTWAWALMLILVGVLWLLHKMGILILDRWWALLFLVPATALFADACSLFSRRGNRVTKGVMEAINGSIFFVLLTIFFYKNQPGLWKLAFPVILILAGISTLISSFLPKK